ncbi:MAG: hypothetical protein ACPL4K_04565, partial [Candidatus Margulisiibacteriota bacterium]
LNEIETFAQEVEKVRKTEPRIDIFHLKSLFILANVELARSHTDKASEIYNKILQIINEAEEKSGILPPHFQMLKERTRLKL